MYAGSPAFGVTGTCLSTYRGEADTFIPHLLLFAITETEMLTLCPRRASDLAEERIQKELRQFGNVCRDASRGSEQGDSSS